MQQWRYFSIKPRPALLIGKKINEMHLCAKNGTSRVSAGRDGIPLPELSISIYVEKSNLFNLLREEPVSVRKATLASCCVSKDTCPGREVSWRSDRSELNETCSGRRPRGHGRGICQRTRKSQEGRRRRRLLPRARAGVKVEAGVRFSSTC